MYNALLFLFIFIVCPTSINAGKQQKLKEEKKLLKEKNKKIKQLTFIDLEKKLKTKEDRTNFLQESKGINCFFEAIAGNKTEILNFFKDVPDLPAILFKEYLSRVNFLPNFFTEGSYISLIKNIVNLSNEEDLSIDSIYVLMELFKKVKNTSSIIGNVVHNNKTTRGSNILALIIKSQDLTEKTKLAIIKLLFQYFEITPLAYHDGLELALFAGYTSICEYILDSSRKHHNFYESKNKIDYNILELVISNSNFSEEERIKALDLALEIIKKNDSLDENSKSFMHKLFYEYSNKSLLGRACSLGLLSIFDYLVDTWNFDVTYCDKVGDGTILDHCMMIEKLSAEKKAELLKKIFDLAKKQNGVKGIKKIFSSDPSNFAAFLMACDSGKDCLVKAFLESGINLHSFDKKSNILLSLLRKEETYEKRFDSWVETRKKRISVILKNVDSSTRELLLNPTKGLSLLHEVYLISHDNGVQNFFEWCMEQGAHPWSQLPNSRHNIAITMFLEKTEDTIRENLWNYFKSMQDFSRKKGKLAEFWDCQNSISPLVGVLLGLQKLHPSQIKQYLPPKKEVNVNFQTTLHVIKDIKSTDFKNKKNKALALLYKLIKDDKRYLAIPNNVSLSDLADFIKEVPLDVHDLSQVISALSKQKKYKEIQYLIDNLPTNIYKEIGNLMLEDSSFNTVLNILEKKDEVLSNRPFFSSLKTDKNEFDAYNNHQQLQNHRTKKEINRSSVSYRIKALDLAI